MEDTRKKTKTSLIPLSPFIFVITHTTFENLVKERRVGRGERGEGEERRWKGEERKKKREKEKGKEGREEGRGIN